VLVDAADPWALSGAIRDILGDPEAQARLRVAARLQLERLDLGSAGDRLVDLVATLRPPGP
jgi:hypothetical protein